MGGLFSAELRCMVAFKHISPRVSVAGALALRDLNAAAQFGFRTIINFRPDGESPNQMPSAVAREATERLGLAYFHVPAPQCEVFTDGVVNAAQSAFQSAQAPVLALCASGQRAAIVWAAAEARNQAPVADILSTLTVAGFDFAFLRDDLDAQADRSRWAQPAASSSESGSSSAADAPKLSQRRPRRAVPA